MIVSDFGDSYCIYRACFTGNKFVDFPMSQLGNFLVVIRGWCIDIDGKSGGELLDPTQPVAVVMSVGG